MLSDHAPKAESGPFVKHSAADPSAARVLDIEFVSFHHDRSRLFLRDNAVLKPAGFQHIHGDNGCVPHKYYSRFQYPVAWHIAINDVLPDVVQPNNLPEILRHR